jgi:uncharacterized protein with HEPN domain
MQREIKKYLFDIKSSIDSVFEYDTIIWGVINKHLPLLKKQVEDLLEKSNE